MADFRVWKSIASWVGWATLALLSLLVTLISLRFLIFNPEALTPELRPNLLQHPFLFFTHTTAAPLAMLAGVFQFLPITRRSPYHRWAGRIYVAAVAVASVTGFMVAFTTEMGLATGVSFAILAVLWFGATARGYFLARAGNYTEHRRWMIRSYALTAAAITLRIINPVGLILGADFPTSYFIAAWGCWPLNLAIAEWIIRRKPVGRMVPGPLPLTLNKS